MSSRTFTLPQLADLLLLLVIVHCSDATSTSPKTTILTSTTNKLSTENKPYNTAPLSNFKFEYAKTTRLSRSEPVKLPISAPSEMKRSDDTNSSSTTKELPSCTCGKSTVEDGDLAVKVAGGTVAAPHSYPWLGILRYYQQPICSTTIINNRYVLTAAHCIFIIINFQKQLEEKYGSRVANASDGSVNLERMSVVLGAQDRNDLSSGTEEVSVEQYLIHPQHTVDQLHDTNDVTLMRVAQQIRYSNNVQPVCLPQPGALFSGKRGVIVGWGHTRFKGTESRFLKHATVYILADAVCAKSRLGVHFREDPHSMVCAYEYKTDACQGDSGGPLLYKASAGVFIQVGVVSWGIECAKVGYPGVYAEVSSYVDWIYDNTKDAQYCTPPKDSI